MSEENLHPDEEVQDTTPQQEGGSDDASELDELFEDGNESQEEQSSEEQSGDKQLSTDERIANLEKENADLRKGFDKAFSEKGQKDKESESTPNQEDTGSGNDDLVEDYIDRHPEMEAVRADAEAIAKSTGRSLYNVLRNEAWLQDKANAINEVNKEKAEANRNINNPSENAAPAKKEKDVESMSTEEFKAYKEGVMQR